MRGHWQAKSVVVSISSASPCASLAQTLAVAGAMIARSAFFASSTCSTSNLKFRSKVSVRHLLTVRVSNVSGVINSIAFFVMMTCTSECCFFKRLARFAALYAAIPPVTPKIIVFPVNIIHILSVCTLVFWVIFEQHSIWRKNCKPFLTSVLCWGFGKRT